MITIRHPVQYSQGLIDILKSPNCACEATIAILHLFSEAPLSKLANREELLVHIATTIQEVIYSLRYHTAQKESNEVRTCVCVCFFVFSYILNSIFTSITLLWI